MIRDRSLPAVASLMTSPKSAEELADDLGCSVRVVRRILRAMRLLGIAYVADRQPPLGGRGRRVAVMAIQHAPFSAVDAPEVPSTQRERRRRMRAARKEGV